MAYQINMPPKLHKIYTLGEEGKYADVLLKSGRRVICKADCYCEIGTEEDEDADVLALSVDHKNSAYGEIFVEDDIEAVFEVEEDQTEIS